MPELRRLAGAHVEVGFVPDLGPVYRAADVVVMPLSLGGTRIKLLEAFAHGVPVVATPAAAAGLDVAERRHRLLAGSADEAATAVAAIVDDDALRARLVAEARALVGERYQVPVVSSAIREFFGRATRPRVQLGAPS